MLSKTWNVVLVAAMATAMATMAVAQDKPADSPTGISANNSRRISISRFGLDNPALRLSPAQQAEIDKIIDAHMARQTAVNKQYPLPKDGARPTEAEMQARQAVTATVTEALGRVMNGEQKKLWEDEQASRRPAAGSKVPGSVAPKR